MAVEAAILYKLMTLYMLNKVDFSLTNATIMDFFTNNGYTDYPTVLTIISNLQEDELINVSVTSSNTSYSITPKGKEMLDFFGSKISDDIKTKLTLFSVITDMNLNRLPIQLRTITKLQTVIMPYIVLLKKTTPL